MSNSVVWICFNEMWMKIFDLNDKKKNEIWKI